MQDGLTMTETEPVMPFVSDADAPVPEPVEPVMPFTEGQDVETPEPVEPVMPVTGDESPPEESEES